MTLGGQAVAKGDLGRPCVAKGRWAAKGLSSGNDVASDNAGQGTQRVVGCSVGERTKEGFYKDGLGK